MDRTSSPAHYRRRALDPLIAGSVLLLVAVVLLTTVFDITLIRRVFFGLQDGIVENFAWLFSLTVTWLLGFALWKQGWIRVVLALSLIVWGAFATAYDMKIAAPLIGVATVLFFMAVFKLIQNARQEV
jgi:hypothetical protein